MAKKGCKVISKVREMSKHDEIVDPRRVQLIWAIDFCSLKKKFKALPIELWSLDTLGAGHNYRIYSIKRPNLE